MRYDPDAAISQAHAEMSEMDAANERMGAEIVRLRARLAEVEAKRDNAVLLRDEWNARAGVAFDRAEAAEARLAKVEATEAWVEIRLLRDRLSRLEELCDEATNAGSFLLQVGAVRAVVLGEGDRPTEWDEHDGASSAAIHSGEGDRPLDVEKERF